MRRLSFAAFVIAATAFMLVAGFCPALATPARTAVFVGDGPRGRGCVEWLRLVASSPELELHLVDAEMVRAGALDGAELLIMPGGDSVSEKRDLGPAGAAKIRDFVRAGGGYIGTCAGCCFALEERETPDRGIGLIPFRRIGSKRGFMMPIALNGNGAAALGLEAGEYEVSYHGGPVLVPSTNAVPDAKVEVWATYASDFDCPKSDLKMFGSPALVGGTYGKGRLFAITCHPEANVFTHDIVKGAFRYVLGREVTFPPRIRRPKSLVVGAFASAVSGLETARTLLAIDAIEGVDFFPLTADEIKTSQLDRVDLLVLPAGNTEFYQKRMKGRTREIVERFAADGGKVLTWGNNTDFAPKEAQTFASAEELLAFIRREASCAAEARCQR